MRLWTVHPRYLDAQGLVALWREALLAQEVLRGKIRGYRHHPQLIRFQSQRHPTAAMAKYLRAIHDEAVRRGYRFDGRKIGARQFVGKIVETDGQLRYEWRHLRRKLKRRSPQLFAAHRRLKVPEPHPLFHIVPGTARKW